jgi:plastocyanin
MTAFRLVGCAALLAACGTSSPGADGPDAAASTSIKAVDCASASPAMMVTTVGNAYQPAQASIPVGGVIKWTLPPQHDVSSTTAGLHVDFGGTVCLQFTQASQYSYKCSVHGFTGAITVQ